jgi:hypothetical protein
MKIQFDTVKAEVEGRVADTHKAEVVEIHLSNGMVFKLQDVGTGLHVEADASRYSTIPRLTVSPEVSNTVVLRAEKRR